jgi:hypothetical protein
MIVAGDEERSLQFEKRLPMYIDENVEGRLGEMVGVSHRDPRSFLSVRETIGDKNVEGHLGSGRLEFGGGCDRRFRKSSRLWIWTWRHSQIHINMWIWQNKCQYLDL